MVKEYLHDQFWKYYQHGQSMPVRITKKHFKREHFSKMLYELGLNKGAEIGTRKGVNAVDLCKNHPNIHLTCVDPWLVEDTRDIIPTSDPAGTWQEDYYKECVENLKPYNVKILRMMSMDALSQIPDRSLDFVYIDACHNFDFIMQDIIEWSKKVKKDGFVSGHDYYPSKAPGVVRAIDVYTEMHNIKEWYVTGNNTPSFFWANP